MKGMRTLQRNCLTALQCELVRKRVPLLTATNVSPSSICDFDTYMSEMISCFDHSYACFPFFLKQVRASRTGLLSSNGN